MSNNISEKEDFIIISTIKINNKRISRTILRQIEIEECFTKTIKFSGQKIIGYINYEGRWLLFLKKGKLRKRSIDFLYKFKTKGSINARFDILRNNLEHYYFPMLFKIDKPPVSNVPTKDKTYYPYDKCLDMVKIKMRNKIFDNDPNRTSEFTAAELEEIEKEALERFNKNEEHRLYQEKSFLNDILQPYKEKIAALKRNNTYTVRLYNATEKNITKFLHSLKEQQLFIAG